jgi:hypothetical protein
VQRVEDEILREKENLEQRRGKIEAQVKKKRQELESVV